MNSKLASLRELDLGELFARLLPAAEARELLQAGCPLAELAAPGFRGQAALLGLCPKSVARLEAAFELGRRRAAELLPEQPQVTGGAEVARLFSDALRDEPVEVFRALLLDARNHVLAAPEISRGTLSTSLVHPREVFQEAVRARAAALVVVHNHPSGQPLPSAEDHAVTSRLARAGRLLGIPLLDHVIIAERGYHSYRECGHRALQGE